MLPMVLATGRDAILAALGSLGLADPLAARIVRVPNTLHLEEVWMSEPLREAVRGRPHIAEAGEPVPVRFDADGRLC
jgi:hypothetical protein